MNSRYSSINYSKINHQKGGMDKNQNKCFNVKKILQNKENLPSILFNGDPESIWMNEYSLSCHNTINPKHNYSELYLNSKGNSKTFINTDLNPIDQKPKWKIHRIAQDKYIFENDLNQCMHLGNDGIELKKKNHQNRLCGFENITDIYSDFNNNSNGTDAPDNTEKENITIHNPNYIWQIDKDSIIHPYGDDTSYLTFHHGKLILSNSSNDKIMIK